MERVICRNAPEQVVFVNTKVTASILTSLDLLWAGRKIIMSVNFSHPNSEAQTCEACHGWAPISKHRLWIIRKSQEFFCLSN